MSGIVIQQLHKRYVLNGQKLEVLDGLSLSLEKGQVTGFTGKKRIWENDIAQGSWGTGIR